MILKKYLQWCIVAFLIIFCFISCNNSSAKSQQFTNETFIEWFGQPVISIEYSQSDTLDTQVASATTFLVTGTTMDRSIVATLTMPTNNDTRFSGNIQSATLTVYLDNITTNGKSVQYNNLTIDDFMTYGGTSERTETFETKAAVYSSSSSTNFSSTDWLSDDGTSSTLLSYSYSSTGEVTLVGTPSIYYDLTAELVVIWTNDDGTSITSTYKETFALNEATDSIYVMKQDQYGYYQNTTTAAVLGFIPVGAVENTATGEPYTEAYSQEIKYTVGNAE